MGAIAQYATSYPPRGRSSLDHISKLEKVGPEHSLHVFEIVTLISAPKGLLRQLRGEI